MTKEFKKASLKWRERLFYLSAQERLNRLGKIETVKVHDFVPGSYEVIYKCFLRIVTRVDFCEGSQLGV